jgi:hypothetical protein
MTTIMIDLKKYLGSYFSTSQPYNKKERRYSSLILGLRDARLITNRNVDTGEVTFKIQAALMPNNWAGTIVYLILLELIGTCFKKQNTPNSNDNAIYSALIYFSSLSQNEARAIESLRHSFAHNYGLINIQRNKRTQKIVVNRTHHFQLTAAATGKVITERKEMWDGDFKTIKTRNSTKINIWLLGDLVESVFTNLIEENKKGNIELILPNGIEELKAKYTVII